MRFLIWGAGAIGGTLGAYLARMGGDVTMVDTVVEHVDAMRIARSDARYQELVEALDWRVADGYTADVHNRIHPDGLLRRHRRKRLQRPIESWRVSTILMCLRLPTQTRDLFR